MTFECPTLLTVDPAFRNDNYTGLYFTPHGAMWGQHVYVIATGYGVDDRIVRYTLTGSGLENPTEIRSSTDGGNSRRMRWLTMGADGRCFAHIEDDNWPAPGASRIVEIDLGDGSDRTITSEPLSPDGFNHWFHQCLLAHPTGGLFALRHQVASGGAEDFELVSIDPDTSTVTVLASTSAHQIDLTGTRLLPIGTTGSWPGMVGTADDALWVITATGSGSGWTYGYRKYTKSGTVLIDVAEASPRPRWWMPDPAQPSTLLIAESDGSHRLNADGTSTPLDCPEWAPYPPTIIAPDWSKAISANWWEAWEEFWLVQGAPPPPVTSGWRVGRIGFPATPSAESTVRLENVGFFGDIPEGTVTFAILRDAAQTSIDDFGSLTGIAVLHTETSGSWEFTVYRCDPASNTSVTVSGWPWFVIAPAWTADGTVAATGVQVFTDADWGANPINVTVTPAHEVAFLFGWTGSGAGFVDTTGGDFSMQALDLDTHMLSFWHREPEDWEDPYPTGPGSLTADFQPPGQLERPIVGGYRFVRVDLLES